MALLTVTTAVGISLCAGTANAAAPETPWDATGTAADVVGAHAWGSITPGPAAGTYQVNATIKDTKADSHGARVNLRASCDDGCASLVSVSASGLNTTSSQTFTLKGPVTVQECLTEAGVDYICGEPYTIIP
ncbi:hypothetical protein [Streptomyces sp. NPDC013457]|uniref:hypothetical protein n=1 Tax=Streptomyces sp. NPDC013457 TaxID=3364866 RepID=UPI0036FC25F9